MDIWTIIDQLLGDAPCRLCGTHDAPGQALCADCRDALPRLGRACRRCALPLPDAPDIPDLCGECLADPPAFDRAIAALRYIEPVNDLVGHFKYHHGLADGRLLAELLGAVLAQAAATMRIDRVVPLPLHPQRLRQRGFNQATELALQVARPLQLTVDTRLLSRQHERAHQRETGRRQRRRNVAGAFHCRKPVSGLRIALVDDVITTGATARAAASTLKRAGADWVEIWAVARTPPPGIR